MLYTLGTVWQSVLGAFIRFWDNRFEHAPDEIVNLLRLQFDRLRSENRELMKIIREIHSSPSVSEETENEMPKPIGRKHWREIAREREEKSRRLRADIDAAKAAKSPVSVPATIDALETELGVN